MATPGGSDPWAGLSHDPRLAEHAHLRAAHRDREAVARVLTEAYADGRLTAEEHDQRTTALVASKTLGELPPLVADLVWSGPPLPWAGSSVPARPAGVPAPALTPELRAKAAERYAAERRNAWGSVVWFTLLSTAVWWFLSGGEATFFWPVFVLIATGFHAIVVTVQRRQRIEEEAARLARKEAKRLRKLQRRQGELPES